MTTTTFMTRTPARAATRIKFSKLGGWIATKASGMKRNKYGDIEDIVKAVRVVGPEGLLTHGSDDFPTCGRVSVGLDLCNLIAGS